MSDLKCSTFRSNRCRSIFVINSIEKSMGCDAFLESAVWKLNPNQDAHGGFDPKAKESSIVQGEARENITTVFPLYICKENWQNVAKF